MDAEHDALLAPDASQIAQVKVFPLIPSLKRDVIKTIDSALSWEQLTASDINFSIVRPIVNKYARLRNMAVVYSCLVVRSYFISEADDNLANAGVMQSRAMMCEILAKKLLSRFASNHIQLVAVLTTTWNPLAGAPEDTVNQVKQVLGGDDVMVKSPQSALEMAIATQAKDFLASPVCQRVVNDLYSGAVVFSLAGTRSILADNYKPRAIEIYDPKYAPFLNHYRLRVPRYGAILEFINFAVLFLTFVLCLANRDFSRLTIWEVVFIIMASAFVFEEYTAATEHGWIIYIANVWNTFDITFNIIFLAYLGLRIQGLHTNDIGTSIMAFDILSCGACILFPRLAFFAISNHVVVLSLRAMISQFVFFIGIAAICFSGLMFTLWTLSKDNPPPEGHDPWTLKSISWLMVQIWFGNTYLSFAQATSFHPLFGPILMTGFAALSNTLLLTILISILSNTVARIDANATQEYLYQFAISTIEGVKSDALFSYQPPFNILAFLVLKPASWFISPRSLHTLNVFLIRITSFPILISIAVYERYLAEGQCFRESGKGAAQTLFNSLPRQFKHIPLVEALVGSTASDLYDAIFDVEIEDDLGLFDEGEGEDPFIGLPTLRSIRSRESIHAPVTPSVQPQDAQHQLQERQSPQKSLHQQQQYLGHRSPSPQRILEASRPRTPTSIYNNTGGIPGTSPRLFVSPALPQSESMPVDLFSSQSQRSPLAKLFGNRLLSAGSAGVDNYQLQQQIQLQQQQIQQMQQQQTQSQHVLASAEASVRRVESMVGDVRELPVGKLKEEMKELQDRQARIENLLLMLTRGMRNE